MRLYRLADEGPASAKGPSAIGCFRRIQRVHAVLDAIHQRHIGIEGRNRSTDQNDPREQIGIRPNHHRRARSALPNSGRCSGLLFICLGISMPRTRHTRSRFVTVGTVSRPVSVVPEEIEDESWSHVRNINDGNYAIIEMGTGRGVSATCVPLNPNFEGWRRLQDTFVGDVPWVQD